MDKVFVYGTLKSGHGNNRLLAQAECLGRAVLELPYKFVCLGGFPGLVHTRDAVYPASAVGGEVWEVDEFTFKRLDRLEGYPNFYDRTQIETPFGTAWTYVLPAEPRYLDSEPGNEPDSGKLFWQQSDEETSWLEARP
jgi:gamma-glutamylaminecyclotransferase